MTKKIIKTIKRMLPYSLGATLSIPIGILFGFKLVTCLLSAVISTTICFIIYLMKEVKKEKEVNKIG
jgi:predicted branched-subunit amino acid permease